MYSIIIPTFNNLEYLKLCIKSIKKNSNFEHQIIPHINIGDDGSKDYVKSQNLDYTYTEYNAGICEGMNKAAKKAKFDYILYAHDDFYFCPDWDKELKKEVETIGHNNFYLSGTMIGTTGVDSLNCGTSINNFDENKLLNNYQKLNFFDFQGSTWAPHLIHKEIWNKVGGFSVEFSPGTGSDPDLNMKLWKLGVRIFKGISKSRVYHFGSVVTRQKEKKFFSITDTGNKGNKIFLKKWGISIKFFKKYYLRSDTKFSGFLKNPYRNFNYYYDLLKVKLTLFYNRLLN